MRRLRITPARAAALLLASCAALALPEVWARVQEARWSIRVCPEEPGRKYELRGQRGVVNADGFRERDFPREKPAGELRVALLGDSVSFGGGLEDEQLASRVAEGLLRERGWNLRVLNFAVHGYDVEQVAATFHWRAASYSPDLVVYAAYTNDGEPTTLMSVDARGTPVYVGTEPLDGLGPLGPWLQARSAMFRRVRGARYARQVALGRGLSFQEDFFAKHLTALRDEASGLGVPVLVWGLVPHVLATADLSRCWPGGQPGFCEVQIGQAKQIQEQTERLGLPYFSALDALRSSGQPHFFLSSAENDPHHPSAAGHAVLGANLADAVGRWFAGDQAGFYSERALRALRKLREGGGR